VIYTSLYCLASLGLSPAFLDRIQIRSERLVDITARGAASFCPVAPASPLEGSRYFCVVASDSCPSQAWTVRTSIPARRQRVAALSRNLWRWPFALVEAGGLCDLLATVVHIAIVEAAPGRRKNQSAIGDAGMLAQDVRYLLRERNDALLPVFGKEVVLRLGPHMDSAVRQIQVAPVQRLQFPSTKARGPRQCKKCLVPWFAGAKGFLQIFIRVCDRVLAKLCKTRHIVHGIVASDIKGFLLRKSTRIRSGYNSLHRPRDPAQFLQPLQLPRDRSHVRLVRDVLAEQAQDVIVFLGRERFAEGADVLDEFRDRSVERDVRLGLDRFFNRSPLARAASSSRFCFCASTASAGVTPAA
jgi:hypothetical protein